MPIFRRLIVAAVGLALPLVLAATAEAAPRHRPAHVRTATYKVVQHKATHRKHAALTPRRLAQAQAQHRHSIMRGS